MMWRDGKIQESTVATFDLADRGLLLADGLFETLLCIGGVPFRHDAHLARLQAGATRLRLPVDIGSVARAVSELAARLTGPGAVRVTVTRGAGPRGLGIPRNQTPTVFATAAPWSPALAFRPQHLRLSTIRRNETSPLSGMKSLAYLDNVLALDAAVAAGGDDAVLLSSQGRVACTAVANVFVLQGRRLLTAPLTDGVLPGTMRALLLALAKGCDLEAEERSLSLDDLREADEVITTNSLRLISQALSLDGRPLGRRGTAALTRISAALCAAIEQECGWRPPVPTWTD